MLKNAKWEKYIRHPTLTYWMESSTHGWYLGLVVFQKLETIFSVVYLLLFEIYQSFMDAKQQESTSFLNILVSFCCKL